MTTSAYHGYASEMIGHTEVQHQTVQETINILTANRTAAKNLETIAKDREARLAEFRRFSADVNTATNW